VRGRQVSEKWKREQREALKAAYERLGEREDEHPYHTAGWGGELWIRSLGMLPCCHLPRKSRK
jgi:hypothetical protein